MQMENTMALIKRAYDGNAFTTAQTAAGYVNPEYWDKALMDHVRTNMVTLQFGVDKSAMMGDGDTYNFTVLAEPAAASAVAESTAVSVVAFSPTQVILSPSEHGIAYQITDKEARRAFFDVMSQLIKDIGYGLALRADALVVSQLQASAGNAVVANSVASSAVASSDTIDHVDLLNAIEQNEVDKWNQHTALIVNPQQARDLYADSNFLTADKFGAQATVYNGLAGSLMGVPVFKTTAIAVASSKSKAVLVSSRDSFLYGFKATGGVRTEYHALERYTDLVGVIDFDVKVARPNAICTIESWTA
jgi:N4-gp56 family major capsid protein